MVENKVKEKDGEERKRRAERTNPISVN